MATQLNNIEIEERIVGALRRREGAATAGDIAADTGLPLGDVEIELRRLLTLYKSHLDVDDDGNLRYRFDAAMVRRGPAMERTLYRVRKALWNGFKLFFKAWIMLMLVGYTITFIVLLLAMAVAAMAASKSSDSDSDGLVELPLYLLARILEYMFWFRMFDDSSSHRRRRRQVVRPEKAFYQKVFDFVFGPDAVVDPLEAQRVFASYVRHMRGRVTPADWASRSGQTLEQAENALTAGIMRFGGEVDVTENGNLIYRFDELRLSARASGDAGQDLEPIWTKRAEVPTLTGNETGNGWIVTFNLFNLVMSLFVLVGSAGAGLAPWVLIALGWVPLVFSAVFFMIPLYRWMANLSAPARVARENQRREAYRAAFDAARQNSAVAIEPVVATEVALALGGEPDLEEGGELWTFETLSSQLQDARAARAEQRDDVVFGQTVFSSDEATKSLAESELEDFERRLAFELGAPSVRPARVAAQTVSAR